MGNASGREEDVAAVDVDGADVEDGGGTRRSAASRRTAAGEQTTCGARARWASSVAETALDRRPGAPAARSLRGCSCPRPLCLHCKELLM